MNTQLLEQARQLSLPEQLELVEALWDNIAIRNEFPPLSDAQRAELDRRLADIDANPGDELPWSEVKAAVLSRLGR